MLLSLRCWWELCAVTGVGHVPPSAMQQTQPNTPSLCYERTVPGGLSGRVASSLPSISAVSSFLLPCLWVRLCHSWPLLWPLGFWHQSACLLSPLRSLVPWLPSEPVVLVAGWRSLHQAALWAVHGFSEAWHRAGPSSWTPTLLEEAGGVGNVGCLPVCPDGERVRGENRPQV